MAGNPLRNDGGVHAAFNGYLTTCPAPDGCGKEYIAPTVSEANDPDRLCPECWDNWNGMTIEDLLR